jgi:uncharacterized protein (TIGR01777 family)
MRIFMTGATGLVGTRLVGRLCDRQDEVIVLTREPARAKERLDARCKIIEGDPTQLGAWMPAVQRADAVINLAGENIFGHRWSARFKSQLRASRVESTVSLVKALAACPINADRTPKVLINASAVGYYGACGDEEIAESEPPGSDFLARLCIDWEQAAKAAEPLGVRVAMIRTGIVLDPLGGALSQMLPLFKYFLGGPVGSGRQWMSWIHYDDLIAIYLLALDHEQAHGPINATAPMPVTNRVFAQTLGRILHKPSILRTTRLILRLALGQVANAITTGQRALPKEALALGYSFRFPDLTGALEDVVLNR